jgi:hypothetical protein
MDSPSAVAHTSIHLSAHLLYAEIIDKSLELGTHWEVCLSRPFPGRREVQIPKMWMAASAVTLNKKTSIQGQHHTKQHRYD